METILLYMFAVAGIIAFILFGTDKLLAKMGARRVPESVLMWLSFFGGATGALAAMVLFRHKTQKRKFIIGVPMMLLFQLSVLGAVLF